jgi:hypothetical protein
MTGAVFSYLLRRPAGSSGDTNSVFGYFEDKLAVEIPKETRKLFDELSGCYLNNRYTEYKDKMGAQVKEPEAKALYSQTQEVFAWLLTLKP